TSDCARPDLSSVPTRRSSDLQPGVLTDFARRQGPLVLALSAEAARAELDALHRQVSAWKATLTADEWKRLRVVILGSQMPRKGRSEEHTSELQSRGHLVCRLL